MSVDNLSTAIKARRSAGRIALYALSALYLVVATLHLQPVWWQVLLATLIVASLTFVAVSSYLRYRRWDRRITAAEVVVAMHSAKELHESGLYTDEEADQAFTDHMRNIG